MICPKCKSENVMVQAVNEVKQKPKHGIFYWIFFGWMIDLLLWFFLTIPKLIVAIFRPRKITCKTVSYGVCQDCGHRWKLAK